MTVDTMQLLRFSRRFGKYYDKSFAPLLAEGLTLGEVHVLLFLANNPGCDTARDVTELRGMSKSQVSQAVELLVGRGFLARQADREDRRVVHLEITPAGAPLAARAQDIQAACACRLMEGLTPGETEEFRRLLAKVFAQADQLMKKEISE